MAVKAKASITISHLIDILSVTRYYLLQSSTSAAPVKPTTNPPTGWTVTEPSYTSGSTNTLYFVDCTVFTNDTFKYSEVSKSSSYEAAKEAYNKAAAVETRVTNAETQIEQNKEAISLRATKTEVTNYVQSRGENLVTNGTAMLGDNTNFSSFIYDGGESYYSGGSFKHTSSTASTNVNDELIPVDVTKQYTFSYMIKNNNSAARYYDFVRCHDIDKRRIDSSHVMWINGSTTTLAQDLNNGDTVVHLTDVSGFDATTTKYYQCGFIIWDYKNSKGYQYDVETYSRRVYGALWDDGSAIDAENNVITLKSPWPMNKVPAGTSLSQCNSGAAYAYFHEYFTLPEANTWTQLSGTITGVGKNMRLHKFWEGTAFIDIGWLLNYNCTVDVTTWITNVSLTQNVNMTDVDAAVGAAVGAANEKIDNIQVGGRNLLVGTSSPVTHTGTGTTNQVTELYNTSTYYRGISDFNGKTFTLSFDWETTATSGTFLVQLNGTPWWVMCKKVTVSSSNKSGRSVFTFGSDSNLSTGNYNGIQLRSDNLAGTIIIKNAMFEAGNKPSSWQPAPEDIDEDINDTASDLQQLVADTSKETLDSADKNRDKALENYVPLDEYTTYKTTTESRLDQTSKDITAKFATTTESIAELNGTVSSKFSELSKYIRFSFDGIEIGENTNTLKLTLDNDMIRFERNGDTIGWWDGIDFHTGNIEIEVKEQAKFGNFAFVPRSDGSLMFLKVDNVTSSNLFNISNCEFESNIDSYTTIGSTGAIVKISQSTLSSVHFTLDATKKYRISYTAKNALINGYDSSSTPWVKKFEQQGDGRHTIIVTGAAEYYFSALEVGEYTFRDVNIVEVG